MLVWKYKLGIFRASDLAWKHQGGLGNNHWVGRRDENDTWIKS